MTSSRQKLRWSLGIAIAVHAALLSAYIPLAVLEIEKRVRDLLVASGIEPPPPPPPQAEQQIIPVTLPAGNFELQYTLGSLKDPPKGKKPKFDQLPKFQPQMVSEMSVSDSLHDAADQAARAEAAMQRMMAQAAAQQRVTEEFVADIVLADSSVVIAPAPAPAALSVSDQQKLAQAPAAPKPAPPATGASKPRQRSAPPTPAPAPRAPAPPPLRQPEPRPAAPFEPAPTQLPQQPVQSHEVYAVPPPPEPQPEAIPPEAPPAAEFIPGLLPAPDRGPGEFTNGSRVFFSKLTAHLFRANQIALANAVKAGSRLTIDVRFFVARDGRVLGAQVVRSTGDRALDAKAEQVILDASPVPKLAADMPQTRLELSFPVDIYR